MKRSKATNAEKERIKSWLDLKESDYAKNGCPFKGLIKCNTLSSPLYCKRYFPTLALGCPCREFPFNYVRRVARELINE